MKIICIGRNYTAHARELKSEIPSEPVFFMKPESSLLLDNQPFRLPDWSGDVHHEIELVVRIEKQGKNIDLAVAHLFYRDLTIGIDFTARDVQYELISKGLPWEKSKSFDSSAVLADSFYPVNSFPDPGSVSFHLDINGEKIQKGCSGDMIFSFERIISYVSRFVTLYPGDLIYTGTPAGVGPVKSGDHLTGYLGEHKLLDFFIR